MKLNLKKLLPIFMLICLGMFKTAGAEEKKPEMDPEATPVESEESKECTYSDSCEECEEKEEMEEEAPMD